MRLLLLGPPGSGKGTQAKVLAQNLHIPHIAPGDIFRKEAGEKTELGILVAQIMASGRLVEDSITVKIIGNVLASEQASKGFVLDGFPRNLVQAEALQKILGDLGSGLDLVVNLVVSEEELLKRGLLRRVCRACGKPYNLESFPPKREGICDDCGGELVQRQDDKAKAMKERFRVYWEATNPLVEYYRAKGVLFVVDGQRPVEEVTESILKKVEELRSRKSGAR